MKKSLEQLTDEEKIIYCRAHYNLFPAATKVYIALKTKLSIGFISDNWQKIINEKNASTNEQRIREKNS